MRSRTPPHRRARCRWRRADASVPGGARADPARDSLVFVHRLVATVLRVHVARAAALRIGLAAEAARERVVREKWAAWMPRMPAWLAPTASVACSALLGVVLASSLPYGGLDANQDTLVLSAIFDSGSMAAGLVMR